MCDKPVFFFKPVKTSEDFNLQTFGYYYHFDNNKEETLPLHVLFLFETIFQAKVVFDTFCFWKPWDDKRVHGMYSIQVQIVKAKAYSNAL